jgi:addiction module HigA family antidote
VGITQVEFAQVIDVPLQRVNEIVKRKRGVTPDTALRFEAALGFSPHSPRGHPIERAREHSQCT